MFRVIVCTWFLYLYTFYNLCAGVMKQQQPASYDPITIDGKHKVTDHYNVHEKLGV